jgi:hypothetical protein
MARTTTQRLQHPASTIDLVRALREALAGLATDLAVLAEGQLAVSPDELAWTLRGMRPRLQEFFALLAEQPAVGAELGDLRLNVCRAIDRLETQVAL